MYKYAARISVKVSPRINPKNLPRLIHGHFWIGARMDRFVSSLCSPSYACLIRVAGVMVVEFTKSGLSTASAPMSLPGRYALFYEDWNGH